VSSHSCLTVLDIVSDIPYSSFVSRMSFYRLKIFQCETSGRGNLTFFEALESEKSEARMLDARFPEQLKAAVLKSVQWRECQSRP
jgi:bromodomain adjacent to zinc finger domain protein 1A